jgi:O-methyltransferase domain/Dimerisation domain
MGEQQVGPKPAAPKSIKQREFNYIHYFKLCIVGHIRTGAAMPNDLSPLPRLQPAQTDFAAVNALVGGHRISQAIYVAAELGIADHLIEAPRTAADLAARVGADAEALYRVLRFLTGLGLFEEVAARTFALTAQGATLRSDVPGSLRATARMVVSDYHWQSWGALLAAVRTGETAFHKVHGSGLFDYLETRPDAQRVFADAMTANTARAGNTIAAAYDFSSVKTLADIGGGRGLLLATLLRAHPHLSGILFDRPEVVADATTSFTAAGVAARGTIVSGDFFKAVPAGADAYMLRHIIHDWNDADAIRILQTCRAALGPNARLLMIERPLGDGHPRGLPQLHFDMEMLANLGGKERTRDEYCALLTAAGLRVSRTIALGDAAGFAIFEAMA